MDTASKVALFVSCCCASATIFCAVVGGIFSAPRPGCAPGFELGPGGQSCANGTTVLAPTTTTMGGDAVLRAGGLLFASSVAMLLLACALEFAAHRYPREEEVRVRRHSSATSFSSRSKD